MFTFGDFDAHGTPGLAAVLTTWPGMPGVELHTVASPGRDGVFYADATLSAGAFTFDLVAVDPDSQGVLAIANQVTQALNPRLGQQSLTVDVAPGWVWTAVLSSLTNWERAGWRPGSECRLRAQVEFSIPDGYGYAIPDEEWSRAGAGALPISRTKGNTHSHPEIEIQGSLTAAQTVSIALNGASVQVNGPINASQRLVLDYADMDFGIWQGDVKVASAVPRMSSYDRLTLPVGDSTTTVTSTGTLSEIRVKANSRRV